MSSLVVEHASRWFGNVVAVNDVSMAIGPGVTGLLGPNGAGKSTLINLMAGFLAPSAGSVSLDGEPTWRNQQLYARIGLVPEREAMYDSVTGWRFLVANAELQRLSDPEAAARRALETVGMTETRDRRIATYSKGMKQRIKIATALVHDPPVLLLDEPFNGMDPRQRLELMELLRAMGAEGRTVLVSSHILEEVEQLADRIEVVIAGRHAASGTHRELRRLMTERPHRYRIRSSDDRALASLLIAEPSTTGVALDGATPDGRAAPDSRATPDSRAMPDGGATPDGRTTPDGRATAPSPPDGGSPEDGPRPTLHVQTSDVGTFVRSLPRLAAEHDIRLREVVPDDESLESVFSYLVTR